VRALGARAVMMPSAQLPFAIARDNCRRLRRSLGHGAALKLDELFKAHTDFAGSSISTTAFVLAMNKTSYEQAAGGSEKDRRR